jgi:hypothetical protein
MATFQSLYASRCVNKNDKLTPVFWKPRKVDPSPLTLFADDSCLIQKEWGCEGSIQKIIALGLCCEIPVGDFVRDAGKGDLPADATLPVLLRSHVADEAAHDLGFRLAAEAYPVDRNTQLMAQDIAQNWTSLENHPIVPAAALEVGVFLCSLGAMRLFGGSSLSHMASQIARDEYRHVAVNMAVMKGLKLNFDRKILSLIDETIDWIFEDLCIPDSETGITVNNSFFRRSSLELIETGSANDLDDLTNYTTHSLPFENTNESLYSRGVGDE